jgi:hypothetical protein
MVKAHTYMTAIVSHVDSTYITAIVSHVENTYMTAIVSVAGRLRLTLT